MCASRAPAVLGRTYVVASIFQCRVTVLVMNGEHNDGNVSHGKCTINLTYTVRSAIERYLISG